MMGGEASLGQGITVKGEVAAAGDLTIGGRVEGRVSCRGLLRLEPGAVLEAEVHARRAVLAGRVEGNVNVDEDVELLPSCRMIGDLRGARIVLHPGAAIRGLVEMGAFGEEGDPGVDVSAEIPAVAPPDVSAEIPAAVAAPDVSAEIPAAVAAPDVSAETQDGPAQRLPPPPMPASALSSGVRSTIVLKRGPGANP